LAVPRGGAFVLGNIADTFRRRTFVDVRRSFVHPACFSVPLGGCPVRVCGTLPRFLC
jgi:hypothetical protein